ncbi:MAG: DUF1189 domain-containing protein [Candidatus Obscuribacterales bacterium]|jgi:hypothetical protein|nr:DUF1189 domain-containing protein [Candidatus Obscuribacterales bacterium]
MEYSIYQAPIYSFYSKDFYRSVGRNGKGTGFLYLSALFFACWTAIIIAMYVHMVVLIEAPVVTELVQKLPDMTFRNGSMSINKPSPYEMEVSGKKIVFDTSGKYKAVEEIEGADALITEEKISFSEQGWREPTTFKGLVTDYTLKAADIKPFLKDISLKIAGIGFVLGLPVFFGHLFLALIYAGVAMIVNSKPGFETALRMAISAMTPGILLSTLLAILWVNFPGQGLITVPITLGLLVYGYKALGDSNAAD